MVLFRLLLFLSVNYLLEVHLESVTSTLKRLPNNIQPILYNITLQPNLALGMFIGTVHIHISVQTNTTDIVLNTNLLDINDESISIVNSTGHTVAFTGITKEENLDLFRIIVASTLIQGQKYNITINYSGTLIHKDNIGFCLIKYVDHNGKERELVTTQLQFEGARRVFPCFDEPHFKAKFSISIIRPKAFTSISNAPLINIKNIGDNNFQDEFEETVNMSTCSVALIVTDYSSTDIINGQRIFADVQVTPNNSINASLTDGIQILSALEDFIGVRHSLNKIDSIALPNDYVLPKGLKSWGVLTYRNSSLVTSRTNLTQLERQENILNMAEAYSQQWFGNLITPSRWNYFWLSEGFVSYFKYIGAFLTKWDLMDHYVVHYVQKALAIDAFTTTRPLLSEFETNAEDAATKNIYKAGAIIRMVQHFITQEVFQKAVRLYLQKNAFKGVDPSDFYEALQIIVDIENHHHLLSNHKIADIMKTWEVQKGYPIINVMRNYNANSMTITQERFLLESTTIDEVSSWYIPLTYAAEIEGTDKFLTTSAILWLTEQNITIHDTSAIGWIIFNIQQSGFYRVNYDHENWERIIDQLCNKDINKIHVLNKAQLLDDAFNLARAGQLNYNIALNLSRFVQRERLYISIASFLNNIEFLDTKLSEENGHKFLHLFIEDMLNGQALNNLTMVECANDTHSEKLNRVQILSWLCAVGDSKFTRYALSKFRLWIKDQKTHEISPDLETVIFCGAIHEGNQKEWNLLYEIYKNNRNVLQQRRILAALGCTQNNDTLKGFLSKILDEKNDINTNDRLLAFKSIYKESFGTHFVFSYIKDNFKKVNSIFELEISNILSEISEKLSTKEQLRELTHLSNMNPSYQHLFMEPINNVKANIAFNDKFGNSIKTWLNTYNGNRKNGGITKGFDWSLKILLAGWICTMFGNTLHF